MVENDINKIIDFIKQDFANLFQGIEKHEPELNKIIKYIKIGQPFIILDDKYFLILVKKFCFDNYSEYGYQLTSKRIDLIEKIFYSNNNVAHKFFLSPFEESLIFFPEPTQLFYLLYKAYFIRAIIFSESPEEFLQYAIKEWNSAIKCKELSISLIIYLPISGEPSTYEINKNIWLVSKPPYIHIDSQFYTKKKYESYIETNFESQEKIKIKKGLPMSFYIIYKTKVPIKIRNNLETFAKERIELEKKVEIVHKKFLELIETLYLFNFNFNFKTYTFNYSWWVPINRLKFDEFHYKKYYFNGLDKKDICKFVNLYSNVLNSGIFFDEKHDIISYRFFQVYNRDNLLDIILDACIILEMLFTRNIKDELKYRLSLNGALFLSSNWDEFNKIQSLLGDLYDFRSSIVHGLNWKKKINSFYENGIFKDEEDIKNQIKSLLNKVLIKLIELLLVNPNTLNEFSKKNYFFENSNIIKKPIPP